MFNKTQYNHPNQRLLHKVNRSRPISDYLKTSHVIFMRMNQLHYLKHGEELAVEALPPPETKPFKRFLSRRGYSVLKEQLSEAELKQVKADLTVAPFSPVSQDYGPRPEPFKIFLESKRKIYVPKHYGNGRWKPIDIDSRQHTLDQGEAFTHPRAMEFKGSLRPKQKPIVSAFLDSCIRSKDLTKTSYGGIISVGCGWGKTVMALFLACQLGRKTLVIVHKEFLVRQWRERILEYIPRARVGTIQGSKVDVDDKDIVIGMLQSISMKDYPEDTFDDFGFTIIDECHHIGAEVFSRALPKIHTFYTLGLSATPKRKDGLSKVFEWYLGPYVYQVKQREERKMRIKMLYYSHPDEEYSREETTCRGQVSMPRMINNICTWIQRTLLMVEWILELLRNPQRNILVLSDRRGHLEQIEKILAHRGCKDDQVGYYVGGMKEKQLADSETKRVILATYSMASEGMDIPALNTLVLASPKSDVEQSVGRILRKKHEGAEPLLLDIADDFSVFRNQAIKRKRFYHRQGFDVYLGQVKDRTGMTRKDAYHQGSISFAQEIKRKKGGKNTLQEDEGDEKPGCLIEDSDDE